MVSLFFWNKHQNVSIYLINYHYYMYIQNGKIYTNTIMTEKEVSLDHTSPISSFLLLFFFNIKSGNFNILFQGKK